MSNPEDLILPEDVENDVREQPVVTERSMERSQEDEEFVPVIIKRTDESARHPDDTLENAILEGIEQLERPAVSLLLSSIAAGLIVGFSAMAVAVAATATQPFEEPFLTRIATALVYPFGFIICVMSGAQLFTEHTATAIYPVLDGRATVHRLLRLWGFVVGGNLLGAFLIALLLTEADAVIGARTGYIEIGHHLTHFAFFPLLVSAVLAGWLMALGAWLVMATPPGSSGFQSIYIVTFLIGMGGLHHSIAGSAEMFTALLICSEFTWGAAARFVGVALLGNLLGGGVFVGVLNYAHIRRTQQTE